MPPGSVADFAQIVCWGGTGAEWRAVDFRAEPRCLCQRISTPEIAGGVGGHAEGCPRRELAIGTERSRQKARARRRRL